MNTKVAPRSSAPAVVAAPEEETKYLFSPDLVTLFDGVPQEAEAVRTMRTHIMARHLDDGRRGLSVCSPNPWSGCSYSAANLAVSLAQVGVSTLLIDGDMRKPGIEELIRPSVETPGLQQLLVGSLAGAHEAIHDDVLPNLSVLYAGGVAHNAQELLSGEAFRRLIERCLRDYELTIVDTPPANQCADGRRISSVVGYSIIVARRDVSFMREVAALANQLEEDGARVVGTVLNET